MRLKAAGTLSLLREHPEARILYTVTEKDNAPMRAVNTRLGYQDTGTWGLFLHKIPEAGASAGPDMEH